MAPPGRLMLIAGACDPQAFLAVAFNAGKDIQQAQNVGGEGPYLSGIGFWEASSSSPSASTRPTLLFSFPLALTELRGSRQFPGSCDGLRPGFGQ